MKRKLTLIMLFILGLVLFSLPASAQTGRDRWEGRTLPEEVAALKLDQPAAMEGVDVAALTSSLQTAVGPQRVIIRLLSPSVAEQRKTAGAAQLARSQIESEQASVLARIRAADPNVVVLDKVQMVLNALIVEIDAAALGALADDPYITRIAPVGNYEIDLSETVPYIGGTAVQNLGFDGSGVSVAVLDSGIDYYHAAFGGSGDPADYAADDPNIIEPGTFPTAKVVGGYDFTGSSWVGGAGSPPEAPDPDPLDDGPGAGHGTHVGHIIGGLGGVAPGVDLYAVKVCSSVSTSCSGLALIQGMEFAVDPNGDGDPSDHIDIVNMSLGAVYGHPFDDDLSQAVDNATDLGVLTVASAGNSSDKPYVTGTPSASDTALSVAQTNVPSALLPKMEVLAPASIAGLYDAVFQPWSTPLTSVLEGPLQYGDGAGGNLNGCAPFAAGSLTGKIVLVDRGACFFSDKIRNVETGGGLIGIIGLVAPGEPFPGGFGGGPPIGIPGYMISQADSNALKSGLPDTFVRFDPASGVPLVGTMAGSSSRGPRNTDGHLKPEIGAPGASVSATAGTGTGEGPFGGTSGAAPMVSGSAALVLQTNPDYIPSTVKARLMNTAETDILTAPGAPLAPISRIGGGEVRVDRAVNTLVTALDDDWQTGSLGFRYADIEKESEILRKTVRIRNHSFMNRIFDVSVIFRDPADEALGAIEFKLPDEVKVPALQDKLFLVSMKIDGTALLGNYMNSGSQGANPAALNLNELDGYLVLDDGHVTLTMPWHVLPRQASEEFAENGLNNDFFEIVDGLADEPLDNQGVGIAQNDAYSLLAVSPNIPRGLPGQQSPTPDIRGVGINTFPVPAGFCSGNASFIWAFAVNTWERQSHLVPVSHQIWLDTNQDGTDDYVVLNRDLSGFSTVSDGRQVTWALNLATGSASAFFFAEHATQTGNTVLLICGEQIGLSGPDILATNVDMDVITQDFYFGGPGDSVTGLTVTPLGERYFGIPDDVPGQSTGLLTIVDFGPFPGNTDELGVMVVTNGDRGTGARGGATHYTEALLFMEPDAWFFWAPILN